MVGGCSSHYAVTNPNADDGSGTIHLTRSYDQTGSAITFKDRVTKQRVSVDNAEITKIGEHEYQAMLRYLRAQTEDE